jgi:hypothetical protein
VDGAEMILRIAQLFEEGPHTIEVEIVVVVAHDAEALVVAEGCEEPERLAVTDYRSVLSVRFVGVMLFEVDVDRFAMFSHDPARRFGGGFMGADFSPGFFADGHYE